MGYACIDLFFNFLQTITNIIMSIIMLMLWIIAIISDTLINLVLSPGD